MILLDTNVLSELMRPVPQRTVLAWVDALDRTEIYTSAINRAEILYGIARLPKGKRKQHLQQQAEQMFAFFTTRILPFTANTAPFYAEIVNNRQQTGQPIQLQDAQIAAITLEQGFTLASRNEKDFAQIQGLSLFNPWAST